MDDLLQVALAVFGIGAYLMAFSRHARMRRWSPAVGLVGQPFWLAFAIGVRAWGLVLIVVAYSVGYAWVLYRAWRADRAATAADRRAIELGDIEQDTHALELLGYCLELRLGPKRWVDTGRAPAHLTLHVQHALEWLEERGRLMRHPDHPSLVTLR
ncbi:MAG: hypothetical protein QM702_00130 [Rubrivivax sp.]